MCWGNVVKALEFIHLMFFYNKAFKFIHYKKYGGSARSLKKTKTINVKNLLKHELKFLFIKLKLFLNFNFNFYL